MIGFRLPTWSLRPAAVKESVWFHAASLGELEMLRPLIEDFHQKGHAFGVSAFSDSALKGLDFLKPIALYAGLSPPEADWNALFKHFKVKKLILAKYDFWPGMMRAASLHEAPVIVVNAQSRKSLRLIHWIFRISLSAFPKLFLFANQKTIADALFRDYGKFADVAIAPDPRWERVARRKENSIFDERLRVLIEKITHLPGPVGIVGSAWLEDLEILLPAFATCPGSLVIVPHDLSEKNLLKIQSRLDKSLVASRYLLVKQMGLLAELYQTADWVWVGGGFGKGIHSLIEPAFHAIPIACGPARLEAFPEAEELRAASVLSCCKTSEDAKVWLEGPAHQTLKNFEMWEKCAGYRALLEECIRIQ
ncbi:MAG: hypothetical protein H7333_10820 [Bdellovibrionales bacterium]|nr:hypothetical protein [Oligoflexia bacterium]